MQHCGATVGWDWDGWDGKPGGSMYRTLYCANNDDDDQTDNDDQTDDQNADDDQTMIIKLIMIIKLY